MSALLRLYRKQENDMKIPKGVKVYEMPMIQKAMITLSTFCIHQGDMRIPLYITTEKPIDFKLMKKAIQIEIQRNDCMRIVYFKKGSKYYEYFMPEYVLEDIPFCDFTGKSKEEQFAWLKEDAARPVKFMRGETFRIKLFKTYDGNSGVYINVCHASMDLYGLFAFFSDLMFVYDALENGKDMPKPLSKYADVITHQLEMEKNRQKPVEDLKFFEEYFKKNGPSFYAGIDCMKQLNETRKRKKDGKARYIDLSLSDPFCDKSQTLVCHVDGETSRKMLEYCQENKISLQNLFYIGMRTYLSKVNEYTDDVNFHFLINRRATLNEKRCGGSSATLLPLRTIIGKDKTFGESLNVAKRVTSDIMRHVDAPTFELLFLPDKIEHRKKGATTASMMFTVCPANSFAMPEGWNCDIGGVSTGYFPFIAYAVVLPSPKDGGFNCYYEYRTKRFTEQNLKDLHNGTMKVINAGIQNPYITVDELLKQI